MAPEAVPVADVREWRRRHGAQTIVKHYRARNAGRADSGIDRLELQVRKEGMKG